MIRIATILLIISGQLFGQSVLTKPYRTYTPATGTAPDPLYDYGQSTTYHYNNLAEEWSNAGEVVAEIIDTISALPANGMIEADKLYSWNGIVVRCRQTHNRTIYDPTETLALFTIYRPVTDDMPWIAGEKVDIGVIRIYDSVKYECIQAHVTQSDWTPTATINVLWKVYEEPGPDCPDWVQPTGAHDSYSIGDCVTFNGQQYVSLINANVWDPNTYPAGWELQ